MSEWIKIEDRLPTENEKVLVNGYDGVFRARLSYGSWQCDPIGSYASDGCVYGITHWMPLPQPPKE